MWGRQYVRNDRNVTSYSWRIIPLHLFANELACDITSYKGVNKWVVKRRIAKAKSILDRAESGYRPHECTGYCNRSTSHKLSFRTCEGPAVRRLARGVDPLLCPDRFAGSVACLAVVKWMLRRWLAQAIHQKPSLFKYV